MFPFKQEIHCGGVAFSKKKKEEVIGLRAEDFAEQDG